MTNQDNDAPGILVTILNDDFTTSESGDIVIVQFSLLSKPNGGADVLYLLVYLDLLGNEFK